MGIEIVILLCIIAASFVGLFILVKRWNREISEQNRFLEKTSHLLVILDEDLLVREFSKAITKTFRIDLESCIGKHINATPLWPDTVHYQRELLRALRLAMEGRTIVLTYENTGPNGRRGTFELKVFPIVRNRKMRIYCIGKDISIEKRMRETVRERKSAEDIIVRLSLLAILSDSIRNTIPEMLKISSGYLGARRAYFLQIDHDGITTWSTLWNNPELEEYSEDWVGVRFNELLSLKYDPFITVIEDLANNPSVPEVYRKAAKRVGTASLVVIRISDRDDKTIGYTGFVFQGPKPSKTALDMVFLRMLASTLTGMLSNVEAQRDMQLFRQSVDAAGQGIAIIDNSGRVVYGNHSYRKMTGDELTGHRMAWENYDDSYAEKVKNFILPLAGKGQAWNGELRVKAPGKDFRYTIESFHPIELGSDGINYVVNTITDISVRKGLEEQLIKARKEAETANRAKSHYLANMSHEIRTPMNAIIGLTYLVLQTRLDTRQENYLDKINAAAKGLMGLINNILDLSKIESGKLELDAFEFSLDEMMKETFDMVTDKAWEKGLKMYCRRSPDLPDRWVGDRYRLGQVLLNLIGNAVKFTDSGHAAILADHIAPDFVRFTVEDTGIGMSEQQIARLFRPFSQAAASTAREYGGSGLGLTISKQIVELMGGDFSVESHPNEGSRFSFTVKLNQSQMADNEKDAAADQTAWVIAADPISAKFHEDALSALGAEVVTYHAVKDALLNPSMPDILFIDIDSLGHDPAAAAVALCDGSGEELRLILSGSMNAATIAAFAPQGIQCGFLSIPYARNSLASILKNTDRSAGHARTGESGIGSAVVFGRVLLADDDEINRQVGYELLERVGLTVETAVNGKEAVEACLHNSYDIILMDLQMPVMNGYEAVSLIRRKYPDIPVIALSASALHEIKDSFSKTSFTSYLAKPIDPIELYRVVGDILAVPVSPIGAVGMRTQNDAKFLEIPGLDIMSALRQVLGNRDRLRSILGLFADENRHFPERLDHAIHSGGGDEAVSLLHTLRGAAGHIGAFAVKDEAGRLEETIRSGGKAEEDEIARLSRAVTTLSEHITAAMPMFDTVHILDRLEDLIRSSNPGTSVYLEKQIPRFSSEEEKKRAQRIIAALEKWDYDAALSEVDNWRFSVHGTKPH